MSSPTLYSAMSGLQATSYRQALQSNNLANANTTGFRAQVGNLRSVPLVGPAPDAGQSDVVTQDSGYSRQAGAINRTGSPWNVALNGKGWLLTRTASGQMALSRDGRLHRGQNGLVRDSAGSVVLGANKNPISLPKLQHMVIGSDGTISGVPAGQGNQQAQQFNQLFIAQKPQGHLKRIGDSRFAVPKNAAPIQQATGTQVKQGYLEGSDVSAVKAMTQLISDTRSFQMETKLVHSTESMASGLNSLISQG
ncbi:flagellar hook-basal body complex protein [Salinisphaera sp. RV14]|uniref:flagellar hook-basal body complex protein n=1 Tax=unclassified Salinisphaera TaxID=2649847 RepID=UPI003F837240